MVEENTPAAIERLESQIEDLAAKATNCRKAILAARIALVVGLAWAAIALLGLVRSDPLHFVAVLTLTIGGIVAYGSNVSTLEETQEAIREAEARRAALIGTMKLRVVH